MAAKAAAFAAIWMLSAGLCAIPQGQPSVAREYQVKAVFLYHFAEFVEWPASAFADQRSPIVLGVLGSDPFGAYLDETVRGERIDGRPLVVQRYRKLEELQDCHVLFVSRSEASRLDGILAALKGRSILTVSDVQDFSLKGGMIRFVIENNKTRLRINLESTKAARLVVSSKLLKIAQIVPMERR